MLEFVCNIKIFSSVSQQTFNFKKTERWSDSSADWQIIDVVLVRFTSLGWIQTVIYSSRLNGTTSSAPAPCPDDSSASVERLMISFSITIYLTWKIQFKRYLNLQPHDMSNIFLFSCSNEPCHVNNPNKNIHAVQTRLKWKRELIP